VEQTVQSPEQVDESEAGIPLDEIWRAFPHTYAEHASGGLWQPYPHLVYLGRRLSEAVCRGGGRIIVNAPPRHCKSEFISHWLPTWFLDCLPYQRVLLGSYGDALASDFGRQVRNEFERNENCRSHLREDSTSAQRWNTPEGGGMMVAGVGGPFSGRGGNLLILDDPVKNWQDAHSHQVNAQLWDWYHSTFYTRAEPGATIVIGMTRWDEDDLVGRLLAEGRDKWEVISLPALATQGDLLGRAPGEPLCEERYTKPALEAIRLAVGTAVWDALYQQAPQSYGAGRLYDHFSAANIDTSVALRHDLPLQTAWDFNSNPGMHALAGQYDAKADVFRVVHEIHGPRMNLEQACLALRGVLEGYGWRPGMKFPWPELHVFGDATGETGNIITSESCYDRIRQHLVLWKVPFLVRHLNANPPVRERLDCVNEALRDVEGNTHVQVRPGCARLLADFRELKSDAAGLEDKHDHMLSHASSAFGYWVNFLRPLWRPKPGAKSVGGRVGVA
jgi:hypothetical protein